MPELKKFKIVYDRSACIGAAVCAALDETNFEMNADGKADLTSSKRENGKWVKIVELDESKKKKLLEAAEGCPVAIIKVIDLETGKELV